MGNCGKKISSVFSRRDSPNSKIGQAIACPQCGRDFPSSTTYGTLHAHIDQCLVHPPLPQPERRLENRITLTEKKQAGNQQNQEYFWSKVPLTQEQSGSMALLQTDNTPVSQSRKSSTASEEKFRWEKKAYSKADINIENLRRLQPSQVKTLPFEQKQIWFRDKCEAMRIPWTSGADWIKVNPDNILLNSLHSIQYCDLHKEVKIQIIGDKVNDAGGLMREWINLCMKELFHPDTGLFLSAGTTDVSYKINKEADQDEHIFDCLRLLGKIVGKALFERITMNAFFDRSIINYILGKQTNLEDIYFYDTQLYNSWKYLHENELAEDDFIDVFAVYKTVGKHTEVKELIPGGEEIIVNNSNKELYIQKQIQYLCVDSVKVFLDKMCAEIYRVIPKQILQVFEAHELEMILNGVPFIDLEEWKQNTEYAGSYNASHKVIQWFWKAMKEFDQKQLSKFLQYCTGSSRTPVEGFKKLESNRGNYAKFQVKQVSLDKKNPYPKAHTCFNRLELPEYSSFEQLKEYLLAIVSNELDGIYGLE